MHRRLRKQQGPFTRKPRLDPLDELIMTVLSQHTSDTNTARAFEGLKSRFPSWDAIVEAPVEEVADAIRSGGLADSKAPRIQRILRDVEEREGGLDLGRLYELSDDEVNEYLCSLSGVGPKTAACVLLFSMGRDAFPVDTHVHRVALRLGLVGPKTPAARAQVLLTEGIAPELRYELHMQLIRHGREICRAVRPRCSECVLLDLCEEGPRLLASGAAV